MGAVTLVAKSELRRRRGAVALLALMVALVTGAVLTSAAGARRTSTVLDRFVEATDEPDAMVGVARPGAASDTALVLELADEFAAMDGVESLAVLQGIPTAGLTEEDLVVLTAPSPRYPVNGSPHLLDGRMPDANAPTEVAVHEGLASEAGVGVGDQLLVPTTTVESGEALFDGRMLGFTTDGPALEFEIVGVFRDTGSFEVDVPPTVLASPALAEVVGEVAAFSAFFWFTGDAELIDLDRAQAILQQAVPGGEVWGGTLADNLDPTNTAFDSVAAGLVLFAVVAGAAGTLALGLAISRQVGLSEVVAREVVALGMSRSAATVAAALPALFAAAVGSLLGAVVAVLLSPRFPISVARQAEIDKGIRVDWFLLATVAAVLALAAGVWALLSAWRQLRPRPPCARSSRRSLGVALGHGLSPAAALGIRSVIGAPATKRGTRVGSAILGAVLGIAGVLGIGLFTASQRAAVEDAARYGWTWDASPDLFAEDPLPIVEALVEDPRVESVGGLFSLPMLVESEFTWTGTLFVAGGTIELTYLDGRTPQSPDEAALGRRTMADLGVGLGDSVEVVGVSGEPAELTVVGEVAVPNDSDQPGLGMILSPEGFAELSGEEFQQQLLLVYSENASASETEAALQEDYPLGFGYYSLANPPDTLSQLQRLRPTLAALAVFMGVLGVIGLLQFLFLSTRRGSGDIAVLQTLGFVRRQIRQVVCWQAGTVAAIGVLVGVPLGFIVGRFAWVAAVDQIGIVDRPTIPWVLGIAVVAVALVGSALLALVPGSLAARRTPGSALRSE